MEILKQVIAYILSKFRSRTGISISRLTKIVYLIDWQAALKLKHQITDLEWEIRYYGPYAKELVNLIKNDQDFRILIESEEFPDSQNIILERIIPISIPESDKRIIDGVLNEIKYRDWDTFLNQIYSTFPFKTQDSYKILDLVKLANQAVHCESEDCAELEFA
jgi:hypothetical protein